VAQLARQQQIEARERERMEQELRVARVIQQTLLPKAMPELQGWQLDALWQPARAVSGDFYDFVTFPDERLGVIIGDVTGKGVPAALVMATSRSVLHAVVADRAGANRSQPVAPGEILGQVNAILYPDMPPMMFVTCLLAIIDLQEGSFTFANAGHVLPTRVTARGNFELRATGMPLGIFPDPVYDSVSARLESGDRLFFLSDGLVEAHNANGEMFGSTRLKKQLALHAAVPETDGQALIACLMDELRRFTGEGWEQEDDLTFLILDRM
jgi:serine phosphatase RsbU (regulator of sigma subunit)